MAQTLHWVTWRQIYCGDDTQRVLKCENLSSHTVMCFPFLVAVKEKWRWTRVIIVLQFLFIFYFMLNVFNSLSLQWDSRVGFVVSGFILWKCFLVLPFLFLCCTSCTHHFRNRQKRVKTHTQGSLSAGSPGHETAHTPSTVQTLRPFSWESKF